MSFYVSEGFCLPMKGQINIGKNRFIVIYFTERHCKLEESSA